MISPYEAARILLTPFLPVVYSRTSWEILRLLRQSGVSKPAILDVGGRKSPYTSGLPARITILDLPRRRDFEENQNLALTDQMLREIQRKRTNIVQIILEDFTKCSLPSNSFDGIIGVEVIEHIRDDQAFVRQAYRILRPGGWLYLTTPNGDSRPLAERPLHEEHAHIRHYTRRHLNTLLQEFFPSVAVIYGVKMSSHWAHGLRSFEVRHPFKTTRSMLGNVFNAVESYGLAEQPIGTAHLFAVCRKSLP